MLGFLEQIHKSKKRNGWRLGIAPGGLFNGRVPYFEFVVLFAFIVAASTGWGALGCEGLKLPGRFGFMLGFGVLVFLAYLAFFVFLVDARIGRAVAGAVGLGSLGLTVWQLSRSQVRKNLEQVDVWLPVLLLFLYTASCLLVLLLHGGDPRRALTSYLPEDNILPQIFADRLWSGDSVRPFYGDWLSSDRPPLQAAVDLLCLPFVPLGFNADDVYGIVSTLCQTVWLPAVYLLARQMHWSGYAMKFMLVWFVGSGFFLLHSIYTWPKLFSASLFLAGLAVLLFCAEKLPEKRPGALPLVGLLWSLALLAHGGILFSLLAVPLLPSAWRLLKGSPLAVAGALAVFALVNVPWVAYQKFYDPPGNRLVKMHLAGVIPVDPRGTWETLQDSYGSLGFSQWLLNRGGNLKTSLLWDDPRTTGDFHSMAGWQAYLSDQGFYRLTGALGLLNIGFFVLAVTGWRARSCDRFFDDAWKELFLMNIGCYVGWILLMFRPDQAIVHQGSFGMVILFMMIAVLGLTRLPVWAGLSVLAAQWGVFAFDDLYYFHLTVSFGVAWFFSQALYWILIGLLVASVCVLLPRDSRE